MRLDELGVLDHGAGVDDGGEGLGGEVASAEHRQWMLGSECVDLGAVYSRLFPLQRSQRVLNLVILRVLEPDIIVDASRLL